MLPPAPPIASKGARKKSYRCGEISQPLPSTPATDSATHINAPLTSMPATPTLAAALVLATPAPPTPSLPWVTSSMYTQTKHFAIEL
ncbi:hypothetical protein Tco_0168643 [Tanacetum coccineum]